MALATVLTVPWAPRRFQIRTTCTLVAGRKLTRTPAPTVVRRQAPKGATDLEKRGEEGKKEGGGDRVRREIGKPRRGKIEPK